jgi:UPF0755 protein
MPMSEIIESNNIIRKRTVNLKAIIAISVVFIVLIGGILFWNHNHPDLDFPAGTAGPEIEVNIPAGSSGVEIGRILAKEGVVKTSVIFFRAATADKRAESISAGLYLVNTHLSAKEAIEQLLDKKRLQGKFLIIEGARLSEIKTNLVKIGFTAEQVDKALNSIKTPRGFETDNLEGLLFPANYTILPDEEVSTLLQGALDRFAQELKNISFDDYAKELNLKPAELLTIASIVQAEGFTDEDFGKVSRVIYNRLKIGMPLQMDSTLLYANKSRGEIRVTNRELKIASKYNTYKYKGLPPGPIGSPGGAALEATIKPTPGNWLYFVTVSPGETKFTNSYSEFLTFKAEFIRNYKAGLFKGSK